MQRQRNEQWEKELDTGRNNINLSEKRDMVDHGGGFEK